MSDKDRDNIEIVKGFISEYTPNKTSYRKPLVEITSIPETSALMYLLTREEIAILLFDIVQKKIDRRKPLSERFFIELKPEDFNLGKSSFFLKIKRFKELNILKKAKGPRMYLFNPAFAHTGLTFQEKYQLGFISEKEFIAKMRFSNKVKQMSGK